MKSDGICRTPDSRLQAALPSDTAVGAACIFRAVGGLVLGTLIGSLCGAAIHLMSQPGHGLLSTTKRAAAALLTVSTGLLFGSSHPTVDVAGAGAIACVAVGAAYNRNSLKYGDTTGSALPIGATPMPVCSTTVKDVLSAVWINCGQALLFGLLGASLDLHNTDPSTFGTMTSTTI